MLYEWDRKKGVERQYAIQDEELRLAILCKLAYEFHRLRRRRMPRQAVMELVIEVLPDVSALVVSAYLDDLVKDCILLPVAEGALAFFHLSIQEYLVALDLASDMNMTRIEGAIQEYFRVGEWWEEPLVFLAAVKRDATVFIDDLHRNVATSDESEAARKIRRLVGRWLQVAELTRPDRLNPRGQVAKEFAAMDLAGLRERWRKISQIV
jgi:hypothetical protein